MNKNKKYEPQFSGYSETSAITEVAKALCHIANELKRANDIEIYKRVHAGSDEDFWLSVKEELDENENGLRK